MRNVRVVGLAAVMACNGGGDSPASACTGYCQHVLGCYGLSGSIVDTACSNNCADASGYAGGACSNPVALTNYFNCLDGLPCSDYALDGGSATDALVSCVTQSGCL